MSVLPVGFGSAAGGTPAGAVERSLRFNSADSAYLNRTAGTQTSNSAWTYSVWLKRGLISAGLNLYVIHGQNPGNTLSTEFYFATDNTLVYREYGPSAYTSYLQTTQVFRDPSAWYHIVLAYNPANSTSGDRVRLYINGVRITAFSTATYPSSTSQATAWNTSGNPQRIGITNTNTFNGYMTEINFIDGQGNLTPSSFGQTNAATGVWEPIPYTGTYGTNGFYLNFSDNSGTTSTTLGKDSSGNGNNWTPNNFSVTAGAGNDSLVDSPTAYGTDTGVGGEVRGNYATLNPLDSGSGTLTNGNLDWSAGAPWRPIRATFGMSSGKWYWEVTTTSSTTAMYGIGKNNASLANDNFPGRDANGWGYFNVNGNKYNNNTATSYGASYTTNDVIGVAFDADNGTLTFYKNGVSQGQAFSGLTSGPYFPMVANESANSVSNFGQRAFAYTAPSGFKALCTQNLPTPTIGATSTTQANKYFNAVLRNGYGSSGGTLDCGFQPDFVWEKVRNSGAAFHNLLDSNRGLPKNLWSNDSGAETNATWFTGFVSNGITFGTNDYGSSSSLVDWVWKANQGVNVTNTAGTITSTVSASTTSGFSIVTYTGNGSAGSTVGHGLGASPSWIITKSRSNATNWMVWTDKLTTNYALEGLNTTGAEVSGGSPSKYIRAVSSTTFTIGDDISVNQSASYTYVAYCFAPVAGYSGFGSFVGNANADGPMVYLGFRPRWLLIKNASTLGDWFLYDTARNTYNVSDNRLKANLSDAEGTGGSYGPDILSNGFKMRSNFGELNGSGNTIIYAAFAESPFKYSLAR